MILVAGATGFLGGEICRRLVAEDQPVRAIVRPTSDPARLAHLRTLGVETVQADVKDCASLDSACRGVSTVISTVSTTLSRQEGDSIERVDGQGQRDLIDAARTAGVGHFILVSFSELDDGPDACPLTVAKRAAERHLAASGMAFTILRPTCFMDIWLSPALGFDVAGGRVTVYGSGDANMSWIALGDVAQFAVEAVRNPLARGATLDLGGPAALSYNQVIALAERLAGRAIEVQRVSQEALAAQRAAAPDSLGQSFAALMLAVSRGDVIPMSDTLSRFPVRLSTVEEHLARLIGSPVAV